MDAVISLNALKAGMSFSTDTTEDVLLGESIRDASDAIVQHTHRRFTVRTETNYYDAYCADHIQVDDLISVSALATDIALNRTYSWTWSTDEYELEPMNARSRNRPYQSIHRRPLSGKSFTPGRRTARVDGVFAVDDSTELPGSTLSGAHNASVTTWTVAAGTGQFLSVADRLLVDSEQALVTAIATDSLTVVRGIHGTTAASHLTGATISRYVLPGNLVSAGRIIATRLYKRKDAPRGDSGGGDFGATFGIAFDREVLHLLGSFRKPVVA